MHLYADARAALAATAVSSHFNLRRSDRRRRSLYFAVASRLDPSLTRRVSSTPQQDKAVESIREAKPTICTADELHYVPVPGTDWRLALWRYTPPTQAPKRNHPLMLLSGVATNAIGFDLSPSASFARHMASQGFDTWIVEVRGAGLSTQTKPTQIQNPTESQSNGTTSATSDGQSNGATSPKTSTQSNGATSPRTDGQSNGATSAKIDDQSNGATSALMPVWDEPKLVIKLTNTLTRFAETLTWYMNQSQLKGISDKFFDQVSKLLEDSQLNSRLNEISERVSGLVETGQGSSISDQMKDLSLKLVKLLEDGQKTVSPSIFDMQERFIASIEDFQKQLELILDYDWDFDHYLEEDIPAAMSYISLHSGTRDGKLLAIGHSMGGILLYAMVSKCCYEGVEPRLKAIVTLASSVDYTTSNSSLKLFLPLADPAQAFNVPGVPLGTLLQAAYNPLIYKAPYILSWLNNQISSQDMMHPELFSKLVLNNFCTVPAKVLLQLTSAFREGGLRNRTGTFYFKEHLKKCTVPVLALAGDEDLICPPQAVYETVKLLPENMAKYKLFGKPGGPHYAHYDLVGGRLAVNEVYPSIIEFLSSHDKVSS